MKRKYLVVFGIFEILLIIGVSVSTVKLINNSILISELEEAPEQITINDHDYKLECIVIKRPTGCIDSSCSIPEVCCYFDIVEINSSIIHEKIDVFQFWAINKFDIWNVDGSNSSYLFNHYIMITENKMHFQAIGGPKSAYWGEGDLVDIIIQVKHDSQLYLLKVSDQPIIFRNY